ncbi:LOW QUALITY PROTEIN: hypothetical protein YC2023_072524 [Brassica napus]
MGPVGRANHYKPYFKADSIVKVDRFEVLKHIQVTDHPFLIRFTSLTIIDEVITGAPEINLQSRLDYAYEEDEDDNQDQSNYLNKKAE